MLRSGKNGTVRTFVPACSARNADMYQRYASGLYRQPFLTLGDSALAVHVVRDVIADECALAAAPEFGEDEVRHRLAESVFRRCQQLVADRARRDCRPAPPLRDVASCADPGVPEREGAGGARAGAHRRSRVRRARRVLGICPRDMAALLRTALLRLATLSAAVAEDSSQGKRA
jgi:hypothetical protein